MWTAEVFPASYFIISSSLNLNWGEKKYPHCDSLDRLNGSYFLVEGREEEGTAFTIETGFYSYIIKKQMKS